MSKTIRDVAIALYGVPHSVSCKVCKANGKCKLQHEELSCVDCIEKGLQKLIDRATPKKVIKEKADKSYELQGYYYESYRTEYHCPSCLEKLISKNKNIFCNNCGQAIDWSDDNET